MAKKSQKGGVPAIARNKRATFEYHLDEKFEAGVALMGWEVKSARAGKVQLTDTYVIMRDGEAYLLNAHIQPLNSASTHVIADPERTRKLLLQKRARPDSCGAGQQRASLRRYCDVLEGQTHQGRNRVGDR